MLHFVNFDDFLTFPNCKILQVKYNSDWNFKRLQTHVSPPAKRFKQMQILYQMSPVSGVRVAVWPQEVETSPSVGTQKRCAVLLEKKHRLFQNPNAHILLLFTNHKKQSQLEVNMLWAAEFTGKKQTFAFVTRRGKKILWKFTMCSPC